MMSYNALGHRAQLTVGMHRYQQNVLTAGARRLNDSIDEALRLFYLFSFFACSFFLGKITGRIFVFRELFEFFPLCLSLFVVVFIETSLFVQ